MEVLSNGYSLNEVAHIANGSHPGNCISLLRINVSSSSNFHYYCSIFVSCIGARICCAYFLLVLGLYKHILLGLDEQ